MHELIAKNKRKSVFVFIAMGLLLLALGAGIGFYFDTDPMSGRGATLGAVIAIFIWGIQALVAYKRGAEVILSGLDAKEISKADDAELYNIIEELSMASGVPMPKIYIIETPAMNAFATGTKLDKSVVAITRGLRSRLTRNEIQGVMAHEMSHVYHRDVLYMTFASIMMCTIVLISEILMRSFFYTRGGRSRSSNDNGNGAARIILMLVIIALAALAVIMSRLFYFSLSRKREYLADAKAAQFTHDPESLARALEKISGDNTTFDPGKMAAAMCINMPNLEKRSKALFSTHPPIDKRIDILRAMAAGTSYENYCAAYKQVLGKNNLPKDKKK